MRFENRLLLCVLVLLTGSSQTRGQTSAFVPPATSSSSPDPTQHPDHQLSHWTQNPTGRDEPKTETTVTATEVKPESATDAGFTTETSSSAGATPEHTDVSATITAQPTTASPSAPADSLSSTAQSSAPSQNISTTEGRTLLTTGPLSTVSSAPAHTLQETNSTALASTVQQQSESVTAASTTTTGPALTSARGRPPAGPTHQEVPSELNVGDEEHKRSGSSSPLDPLLAGLLSVFIVTTAIIFVVLFLKFRQRTNHPEFHRLQDLPMDDLMEDTPLSRYSY